MDIKIIKKKYLMLLLILFCFPKNINALSYEDYMVVGERIPDIFFKHIADIGLKWNFYGDVLRRTSDNHFVYCIEPGMEISKSIYIGTNEDILAKAYITEEEWNKITLLAYYGYNYQEKNYDHTDIKWYAITQLLIWQELRPNWDIYFTDKLNGSKLIDKFQEEIRELNTLVNNHNKIPDFNTSAYSISINEKLFLVDQNNILDNFKIKNSENLNITKNNNELIIEPKNFGNYEIEIYNDFNKYSNDPLVYTNDFQDTMIVGNLKTISTKINISVHADKINIQKFDYETKLLVTQNSSVYKIYDENNNIIDQVTINDGLGHSNFLPKYGKYYLLEEQASEGYQLDVEKHYFEISENNINLNIIIYSKKEDMLVKEKDIDKDLNTDVLLVDIPVTGLNVIKNINYKSPVFIIPNINYDKKKQKNK